MITLTFQFETVEAAADFLDTVQGERTPQVTVTNVVQPDVIKKARKPRSDAGKARGPYKPTGADPADTASSTPATTPTADAAASDPGPAERPSATPTAAESAPTTQQPTLDDVKAAMTKLSKAVNIDANIKMLAKFGVQKASQLPPTKYGEFIAAVLAAAGVK